MPQDFSLKGCLIFIRFLQEVREKGIYSSLLILLVFSNIAFFSFQSCQSITFPMIYSLFMKETSVSLSFSNPFNSGFLAPVYLLLMFTLAKFLDQQVFLLSDLWRETGLYTLIFNFFDFTFKLHFRLENITRRFFIPLFNVCFKDF